MSASHNALKKSVDSMSTGKKKSDGSKKSNTPGDKTEAMEEELQAVTESIEKMKKQLVKQERKFTDWESNFREEIPQLIEEAFKNRINSEVENEIMKIELRESIYDQNQKDNSCDGFRAGKKIRKVEDVEDEDERKMVQKLINESIQAQKKQKAKEEEIKKKYEHLIKAEVRNAIGEQQSDVDSSTSDDEQYLENVNPAHTKHALHNHQQYNNYASGSCRPRDPQDESYAGPSYSPIYGKGPSYGRRQF